MLTRENKQTAIKISIATYLGLGRSSVIITVGRSAEGGTRTIFTSANSTPLCEILLALRFPDLDLLFLATAAKLLRLEGVLRLELGASMLGDVSLSHGCGYDCSWMTEKVGDVWRKLVGVKSGGGVERMFLLGPRAPAIDSDSWVR